MRQLIIEPEFQDKIPPLSADEYSRLEANILEDGEIREPIVVWGNTIIDGHNRYKIVQAHPEIPFKVKQMNFSDKWDAIVWMCRNQLGRRNLTDEQRTSLIGEAYKAQKMSVGASDGFRGNQYTKAEVSHQNGDLPKGSRTKDMVAKNFGVGSSTVERAEHFVDGLDAAEAVSPGIKDAVLIGEVKAPKKVIAAIRNIPKEERFAAVEAIKRGETVEAKSIVKRNKSEEKPEEEERPPFDADDLRGVLMAAVNAFDFSLDQHLVQTHLDILRTKDGKKTAEEALFEAKEVIKKYFRHIDSIVIEED